MTTGPILWLDDVSRVHGQGETAVRALEVVTLKVHPGELVAVMGPSGSGKSTLLNLAGGLDQPTSGRVLVEGAGGADGEGRIACRLTDQGQAEIRRLARVETRLARAEARARDTASTYRGCAPGGVSR